MVLVTSRNQLRGLVVQYGARRIVLDQMSPAEAGELLAGVIGPERVAAEPEAAAEIVERCARLPLALRIFAERAARFPRTPLRRLAADLRDERTRLAALDAGDGDDTDLRMVFSWTYGALEPEAARLFRLLGLHPGPEVSTGAAGALLGEPDAGRVTRLLDRLTADHLLRSRSPGRYDFHDLLRAYAAERARAEGDAERDGEAALRRVLDWYLHSALDAAEHLPSGGRPFAAGPVPDGLAPHDLHDAEGAVCWYEEELANLMAATHAAAARGWHDLAWRLPRALARFFDFHVPGRAWVQVYQVAVNAARAAGEPLEEGVALNHLARALALLGRPREAARRFEDALAVARRAGERDLEGAVLVNLGTAYARLGRSADSTGCFAAALALARETGDRRLEAEALDDMAQNHNALGRYEDAASAARSAAEAATAAGDRYRRGEALRTLGTAYAGLGRHEEAVTAFLAALEVKRAFEDRRGEADVLHRLGRALVESGDPDGARSRWRESLAIFAELDDPRAADVRRSLAETGPRPAADPRQETPVT
ncbi:tetratricopeptide repeat protein [Thermocatellispora tengchongensis]